MWKRKNEQTWIYTACFSRIQEQCVWATRWQKNVQTSSEKTLKKKKTTTRTIETVAKSYHRKYMKTATKHCPNNSATVEECFVLCQSLYPYCRFAKLRERSPGFSGHCTIGRGLKFLRVCFFPVLVIPWHFCTIGVFLIRVVRRSSNGPAYLFSGYTDFIVCNVITVWDAQDQMIFDFPLQGQDLQEYKKMDFIEMWNMSSSTVPV